MNKLFVFGVVALLVSGCGGSSSEEDAPVEVSGDEGLWVGTTGDSRATTGIFLDDGRYYFFYSTVADDNAVEGVVSGSVHTFNGNLTSNDGVDLNVNGELRTASAGGTFQRADDMNIVVTSLGILGETSFSSAYDENFEETPSLALVLGDYTGTMTVPGVSENLTMQINAQGDVSGTGVSGCSVTGTIQPRNNGNVYNVDLVTGETCAMPSVSIRGHAYFRDSSSRLFLFALNTTRDYGVLIYAQK
jgi:hypothetical protein